MSVFEPQPRSRTACAGPALLLWLSLPAAHGNDLGVGEPYELSDEASQEAALKPTEIEADGATVGKITVKANNIFDLSNPLENKRLYRWANRLHVVTKPYVIESQMLLEPGDPYSVRLSDESERILRLNSYLREAEIKPVSYEDGVVDLEVETTDVWTLTPEISLGRSGGENSYGFGMLEQNLLGRGIQIGGQYKSTVDRDILFLEYTDNNFLLDRYRFALNFSDNSDGFYHRFEFGKPFYALDRRRAGNLQFNSGEQVDSLYDRGDIVAKFNHEFQYHETSLGFSRGLQNGWVRRYSAGVAYTQHEFAQVADVLPVTVNPEDREFLYPFVQYELVEDKFETTVNFDQINVTEDRFLGNWFNFRLGYSSTSNGSSSNAWHFQGRYGNSLIATNNTSLAVDARLHGRWESGDAQNTQIWGGLRFHRRLTDHQLFYASISGSVGRNLDIDNPLYLGGKTGLRGYPLRYQNGDSHALLTLEHRIFTDWYPFRLVHVGAAIFFDAGRTWGDSPVGAPNLGVLKDVGFGLRLGNTRSGNAKVLHIDIAFPLDGEDDIDGVQILLDAKTSF